MPDINDSNTQENWSLVNDDPLGGASVDCCQCYRILADSGRVIAGTLPLLRDEAAALSRSITCRNLIDGNLDLDPEVDARIDDDLRSLIADANSARAEWLVKELSKQFGWTEDEKSLAFPLIVQGISDWASAETEVAP